MGFINFDITVSKGDGNSYLIKSKYELGGEPSARQPGPPDLSSAAFQQLQSYLIGQSDELSHEIAQTAGGILHSWLFTGSILISFVNCLGHASNQGKGVRLRLNLEEPSLQQLPWEYLYDAQWFNDFLALFRNNPIVRSVELPMIPKSTQSGEPQHSKAVRLLLTCSVDPADGEAVASAKAELAAIVDELADLVRQKRIVVEVAEQVNLDQLQQRLKDFEPDLLHIVAASQAGQTARIILFDKKTGQPDPKTAKQLRTLLRDTAKVVILSAPPSQVADNNAGLALAEALIRAEIPAVIALHREMPAPVAGRFAAQFYRYLAVFKSLDEAITEMRINIHAYDEVAWGIPTMYMRSRNGRLWDEDSPNKPPSQAGPGQPPVFQSPVSQPPFQMQDPFALLMQLNYQSQVKGFKAFLSKQRIGGCLVRSQPQVATEMGIKLLMKRLLNLVPSAREQPLQYRFDLASLVLNNGPDDIWAALALKLKLYQLVRPFNAQAQEEIAAKLGEQLARRHVFFIFKHVDADTVETLVSQFWEPLVGVVQKSVKLPEGGFLMLAFFLDHTGTILPQSGGKFIEIVAGEREHEAQPVGGWLPEQDGASFALPAVTDFTVADLDFLANHFDSQALDEVKQTMNLRADGKRPDFVLNVLVDTLNLEQNVGFDSWLNQY